MTYTVWRSWDGSFSVVPGDGPPCGADGTPVRSVVRAL